MKIYTLGLNLTLALMLVSCQPGSPPATSTPTAAAATETPMTAFSIPGETPTPRLPQKLDGDLIQFIYFYRLYKNSDFETIARRFGLYILTEDDVQRRDQIISMGAKGSFIQYVRFDAIQDIGACDEQPWRNQVTDLPGDFCRISQEHPDWFLLDKNGERISIEDKDKPWYVMDPGNQGWREFFLERITQRQAEHQWNGVFLDNVELTLSFREQEDNLPTTYSDDASYQVAVKGFLEFLHTNFSQKTGHPIYANIVSRRSETDWALYLPYLDGVMHEGWSIDWPNRFRPAEVWEKQMDLAEQTQGMNKYIILVAQGTKEDEELQKFAFASYLLVSQGRAAFRYGNSDVYREVWLYSNYEIDLGLPLGPRYREDDQVTWRRDFENGWVTVNPETHAAQITVEP